MSPRTKPLGHAAFDRRSSGVLLHPTSLPGPHGVGDLGPEAHRFAEQLAAAGQRWWQMLPIGPIGGANSPYDSPSTFAGSPLLISLEELVQAGLLRPAEIVAPPRLARANRAVYGAARRFRLARLALAFERFAASKKNLRRLAAYRTDQAAWLSDYALFQALRDAHAGATWIDWEPALRDRKPQALERARRDLASEIAFHEFVEYEFDRQWQNLRAHCHALGVELLGDVPMFVAHDGADVWANRELFYLDARGRPSVVAGVPPDDFSKTGQLWGNPLYRWSRLKKTGYAWWVARLRTTIERFDGVRLDHFIGFRRYWEVKAQARTAKHGRFVRVPGEDLFAHVERELGGLPFIAEDLGLVTEAVHELRRHLSLPGMAVLEFAWGDAGSDYLPHRLAPHTVVYTGTHDNDTVMGWVAERRSKRATPAMRSELARAARYTGSAPSELNWGMIRAAFTSRANTAIFPLQDLLGLGSAARMNVPGVAKGNWTWRYAAGALEPRILERLAELTKDTERAANS